MAKKPVQPTDMIPAPARPVGRPRFVFTQEAEEEIISGIIAGKSIREIIEGQPEGFPDSDKVYLHIARDDIFAGKYARAREMQQDTYAEEIIAIADKKHPGFVDATVEERKLAIESRKWTMGKLRPKKWNEKLVAEITGADGAPLVPVHRIDVASLTDESRDALKVAMLAIRDARDNAVDAEFEDDA